MIFKNITIFKIIDLDIKNFKKNINKLNFIKCSSIQKSAKGFINPFVNNSTDLLSEIDNFKFFCLLIENKILPSQVINEKVIAYIENIETTKSISNREKLSIKENIERELLPQAFSKFIKIWGYLDLKKNFLVVNSISNKQINETLELLNKCDIKLVPIQKEKSNIFTNWFINNSFPDNVEISNKCRLINDSDNLVTNISLKASSLLYTRVKPFIESGSYITELSIFWESKLSMNINQNLQIKSIKFIEDFILTMEKRDIELNLLIMASTFTDLLKSINSWIKN